MNECIKAIVDEACDAEATVESLLKKDFVSMLPEVVKDAEDGAAIANHLPTIKTEAQALLTDPASDADLLAYVAGKFAGNTSKAAKIIPLAAKLALDVVSDAEALIAAAQS